MSFACSCCSQSSMASISAWVSSLVGKSKNMADRGWLAIQCRDVTGSLALKPHTVHCAISVDMSAVPVSSSELSISVG